jgi:transposase-like protein
MMSEAKQEHSVLRSPPRRKFTAEFKQQAVRLVTDEKYSFSSVRL